ncbi:MAG: hypothetical protein FLDDKLPJ_01634 [Phycisphaerae bacterium]|nr:hypothetical protein [Phycisphaerae bacterium]
MNIRCQPVAAFRQGGSAVGFILLRRSGNLKALALGLGVIVAAPAFSAATAWAEDATKTSASTEDINKASGVVIQAAVQALAPGLVRIETVGGAQPREGVDEQDPETEAPRPRAVPFRDTPGSSFRLADGPTTGVIWSADGLIVTSSFNFVRDPLVISVVLPDGRRVAADLVARDQVHKVALLKVDASGLHVPRWAPTAEVRVGQTALALGLGFGSRDPAVSAGVVSALGRMSGTCVQTDALLSPVNYGGPLADLQGRIIGLCVPMAQRPGELAGIEMYDSGVGFALTAERVRAIVAGLETGRNVYRGWLGIQVDARRPDAVILDRIADPSPMRDAGAQRGDRIIEVGGRKIRHYGHFVQALALAPAGMSVPLRIVRGEETLELTVTLVRAEELGPLPEDPQEPFDPADPHGQPSPEQP